MRIFFTILSAILFLLQSANCFAQEYLWPTDASHWITSAFGEHRPRRLHAAIDIKTWGQSGYKIFAVRDGYVSRLRVSPSGYGKAIYLKLDTGEIVVYAHLSGFNKTLADFVYHEQQKNQRYRLDRYLSAAAFPVKKGDFLGYTGETGIGVPHLHFEMRDAKNRPFNPFLRGYKIDDVRAPTIKKIAFIPLKFDTRINDDFITHIASLKVVGKNRFTLERPVSFDGEMGIAVRAFDRSGTVRNAFGVYKLSLYLDGVHLFTSKFDKFSYAYNRFMDLDREYRLRRRGYGKYYRLFLDPANPLSFYHYRGQEKGRLIYDALASSPIPQDITLQRADSLALAGLISHEEIAPTPLFLNRGKHYMTVIVEDFFGNQSVVSGEIIAGKKAEIAPRYLVTNGNVFLDRIGGIGPMNKPVLQFWKSNGNTRTNWSLADKIALSSNGDGDGVEASLPLHLFQKNTLLKKQSFRFVATDDSGLQTWPAYLSVPGKTSHGQAVLKIESDFYDHWVRFKITSTQPLRKKPFVELTTGDHSTRYPEIWQSGQMEYLMPVSLFDFNGGNVRLLTSGETVTGEFISADSSFDNFHVRHKTKASFSSPDGEITVDFNHNSLYDDLFGRVYLLGNPPRYDKDAVSDIYIAEPQDVPMNKGVVVRMHYPADFSSPEKLGLYYRTRKRWAFIDNKIDTVKKLISARVFSLEKFAVRKDDTAPTVTVFSPRAGEILSRRPVFKVRAKDEQSGFASEEKLVMRIDGKKMIAEFDPETGMVQYQPRQAMKPGRHEFRFTATDRSGNQVEISRSFQIK